MDAPHAVVLVVDDEPLVRALARRVLANAGHDTLEAADGAEALRLVLDGKRRIDVVVSDVMMPRLDGIALARELRTRCPAVPVVLMSAQGAAVSVDLDLAGPRVPLLTKPITPAALLAAVDHALHHPAFRSQ